MVLKLLQKCFLKIILRTHDTFVPKLCNFLIGQLYIILKLKNLEIGEHLTFFNY